MYVIKFVCFSVEKQAPKANNKKKYEMNKFWNDMIQNQYFIICSSSISLSLSVEITIKCGKIKFATKQLRNHSTIETISIIIIAYGEK